MKRKRKSRETGEKRKERKEILSNIGFLINLVLYY